MTWLTSLWRRLTGADVRSALEQSQEFRHRAEVRLDDAIARHEETTQTFRSTLTARLRDLERTRTEDAADAR